MKFFFSRLFLIVAGIIWLNGCVTQRQPSTIAEAFINGDALPDAPELAVAGKYKAGVRTLTVVHKNQTDILHSKGGVDPLYDRPLKLEVWYPAIVPEGKTMGATYQDVLGNPSDSVRPVIPFTFMGRALRDAAPEYKAAPFPLVIVSHGYPGSRVLLTYLTENLASKGYVVVAIDHTESTHSDTKGFQSTLLNRPKDILFVLDEIAELAKSESGSFLAKLADAGNTALIGYSMGGYGVLNAAGAGYSEKLAGFFAALSGGSKAIGSLIAGNPAFKTSVDPRIKAVVAFAPWGMQRGVWDGDGLKGLKVPVFFIAGNKDDVSGYEDGTKAIYEGAVLASRYLLTYENARHNVAPNPPPPESLKAGLPMQAYYHYAEPAWNERRINNINQHFITAFLGIYLKQEDFNKYLWVNESPATQTWPGFKQRTSVGMQLLHANAGN